MGFTYVIDSSSLEDVEMDGRELTFALLTPNSVTFTYKVMSADTAGDYDFSGNLVDDQQMMHAVAGDSRITAGADRDEVLLSDGTDGGEPGCHDYRQGLRFPWGSGGDAAERVCLRFQRLGLCRRTRDGADVCPAGSQQDQLHVHGKGAVIAGQLRLHGTVD